MEEKTIILMGVDREWGDGVKYNKILNNICTWNVKRTVLKEDACLQRRPKKSLLSGLNMNIYLKIQKTEHKVHFL